MVASDIEWDDLRFFLALARVGTVSEAAKTLQVSRSTVVRRWEKLEASTKLELFYRSADGVTLSAAGESLLPVAEAMEAQMDAAQRVLAGHDEALSGPLSITVFDMGPRVFAPAFTGFAKEFPRIDLTVTTSNEPFRLERCEADIAVRASSGSPDEHLFGRKVGRFEFAVYGTPEQVALDDPAWVLPDESLGAERTWEFARSQSRSFRVSCRMDRIESMVSWIRAGMGVGLLPVQMARSFDDLVVRGRLPEPGLGMDVWVLAHPDLRRSAKIRAAIRHFGQTIPPLLALEPVGPTNGHPLVSNGR